MKLKIAVFGLFFLAGMLGVTAHADTITDAGSTYTLSYTNPSSGVYDVYLTIDASAYSGGSATYSNFLHDVALQLAKDDSDYDSVTVLSSPAGYADTITDGGLSGTGCNASGSGFFCLDYTGSGLGVAAGNPGDIYTFEFQVDDADPLGSKHGLFDDNSSNVEADYEFLNTRTNNVNGMKVNDKITMSPAPEPASIALLGTALLAAALLAKKLRVAV
jgi:hypothetical protein